MKKFNEWKSETNQVENPEILVSKLSSLIHELEVEISAFQGERFEGFLNVVGGIRNLQRAIAEVEHNCVGDTPTFQTESKQDCCSKCKSGSCKCKKGCKCTCSVCNCSKSIKEDCGKPHPVRGMKKLNDKEVISKGVRKGSSDLSKDYKGHIKMNGDVEPFKVVKKR